MPLLRFHPHSFQLDADHAPSLDEIKSLKIFATSKDKVISGTAATTTVSHTAVYGAATGIDAAIGMGAATGIGAFNFIQGWTGAMVGTVAGLFAFLS